MWRFVRRPQQRPESTAARVARSARAGCAPVGCVPSQPRPRPPPLRLRPHPTNEAANGENGVPTATPSAARPRPHPPLEGRDPGRGSSGTTSGSAQQACCHEGRRGGACLAVRPGGGAVDDRQRLPWGGRARSTHQRRPERRALRLRLWRLPARECRRGGRHVRAWTGCGEQYGCCRTRLGYRGDPGGRYPLARRRHGGLDGGGERPLPNCRDCHQGPPRLPPWRCSTSKGARKLGSR